jgi:hypothetical protein
MQSNQRSCVTKVTLCNIRSIPRISSIAATKKNSGGRLFSSELLNGEGTVMLAIGILAAGAGLALGLRFHVITLLLLTLAIVLIFVAGVLAGTSPLAFAFKMLVALASVQISYLFGTLLAAHFPARAKALGRTKRQYISG